MIPNDLAARLRLLTESVVHPVSPVRGITADLPELPVGQRFTARIESAQLDGTFRALVANRSLTLALPQPAKAGDTLDLVVTARTPRLIIAESAENVPARLSRSPVPPPSVPSPSTAPTLSRAGRIISTLLTGEHPTPQPATISRSAPLLPMPAQQAVQLAPALQQLVVESGLFYESHQAQWVAGRYPLEALTREPQARHLRPQRAPVAASAAEPPAEDVPLTESARSTETVAGRASAAPSPALPADLQTLVQQQLDAAATQHIVWRGEIWPGQNLHLEIEADERHEDGPGESPAEQWATSLALTLPGLGEVNAVLRLTSAKVSLAMTASAGATVLQQGLADLASSFAAAGLPPLAAVVESHEPA
ncbi:MAG: flagellar hook-length control protein FliK [Betaproteobacteria bacterium]|nr:flagellar hook-length control protein FliK [Betaproteobacteria bacterium]